MIAYSHTQPSEPGWYWCRAEHFGDEIWEAVVRVERDETGLFASWLTSPVSAKALRQPDWDPLCLWSGPLTPPTKPANN